MLHGPINGLVGFGPSGGRPGQPNTGAASRGTLWRAIRTALAGFGMQECINDYTR